MLISAHNDGTPGNGHSYHPTVSADGQYIAFHSESSNLVDDDTNGVADVFKYDWSTNTTMRISVGGEGNQADGPSRRPAISSHGAFIAFESCGSNLVDDDENGKWDVFPHDQRDQITIRVSIAGDGTEGDGDSYRPSLAYEGLVVAFESDVSNLVPRDTNGQRDIFVHHSVYEQTVLGSVAGNNEQANGPSDEASLVFAEGRQLVAFRSEATNLVSGDSNNFADIVFDRDTQQTSRVSVFNSSAEANGPSFGPSVSHNARFVVFASEASSLTIDDVNGVPDVVIYVRN